jgi:HK97 family phage major capsid protein
MKSKKPYIPNNLLGERGRRTRFGFACFKTDADPDTREALLADIREMMKDKVEKGDVDTIVNEQFKDLPENFLRTLADKDKGVMAIMQRQGQEIETLKTRQANVFERPKTLQEQVKDWQTRNKAAIDKIKSGERAELTPLEVRVTASPMTPASVDSGASAFIPNPYIQAGVVDIPRLGPTFWDFLNKGRTSSAVYVWVNKTNPQGAAAFIGPGVAKPGVSFELITDISNAKKVAVSAKAALELLEDFDGMVDMIQGEMRWKLYDELNTRLMTGTASATVPAGIRSLSSAYTSVAIKTLTPNAVDAIAATSAYLKSGVLTGTVTAFINPIDAANMDLLKSSVNGTYLLPPFMSADGRRVIAGTRVIEDAHIPAGSLQIGFLDYFKVLIYKDFTISMGWENDDFTKNLVTWVAEMRIHQYFNQQYTGAFIYDTFANIITKLT